MTFASELLTTDSLIRACHFLIRDVRSLFQSCLANSCQTAKGLSSTSGFKLRSILVFLSLLIIIGKC